MRGRASQARMTHAHAPSPSNLRWFALCLGLLAALCCGCAPLAAATPVSPASAQTTGPCTVDAECTLIDVCGCECRAELGRAVPPMACSEACGGTPCAGHRAVCRGRTCVMQ